MNIVETTDISNNVDTSSNSVQTQQSSSESVVVEPKKQEVPQHTEEKRFTQSEVNHIIGKRLEREAEHKSQDVQNIPQNAQNSISVEAQVQKTLEYLAMKAEATQIANNFVQKLQNSKDSLPDLDQKLKDLDLVNNPLLVSMTNKVDKTAEVLYKLAEDPDKYAKILTLAEKSPNMAMRALNDMSNSIKQNETAKKQPIADKPINQIKQSTSGTSGNLDIHKCSISDMSKNKYLMRDL